MRLWLRAAVTLIWLHLPIGVNATENTPILAPPVQLAPRQLVVLESMAGVDAALGFVGLGLDVSPIRGLSVVGNLNWSFGGVRELLGVRARFEGASNNAFALMPFFSIGDEVWYREIEDGRWLGIELAYEKRASSLQRYRFFLQYGVLLDADSAVCRDGFVPLEDKSYPCDARQGSLFSLGFAMSMLVVPGF